MLADLRVLLLALTLPWLGEVGACFKKSSNPPLAPGPTTAAAPTSAQPAYTRPPLPGDFLAGWETFNEHCVQCHGPDRRGTGEHRNRILVAPIDLRDPILLASRTDGELAKAILLGGLFVGRSKWMPGFAATLTERDAYDVVALLRGDSIYLEECFADAAHYLKIPSTGVGPTVLEAYSDGPLEGRRPRVYTNPYDLPPNVRKVGLVMFAELDLPKAGPSPVGFVANLSGKVTALRVGLPTPHNLRAQKDLEDMVLRQIPKLPKLNDVLNAGVEYLASYAEQAGRK